MEPEFAYPLDGTPLEITIPQAVDDAAPSLATVPSASASAVAIAPPGHIGTTVERTEVSSSGTSSYSSSQVVPEAPSVVVIDRTPDLDAPQPFPDPPATGDIPPADFASDTLVLVLQGTTGDDLFGAPEDGRDRVLDGGDGIDTASYAGPAGAFLRSLEGGEVTLARPDGGTDRLTGIERVTFDDGALLYDLDSEHLEFCYRLYAAAFDRRPDEAGLRHWVGALDEGMERDALADAFVASDEFAARYGPDLTDEAYVAELYERVLLRPADSDGLGFWLDQLSSGALDRGDLVMEFSESGENVALVAPDLEDGVFVL